MLYEVITVIYDGDFVEVPVRDKHGHNKKLYAHYHRGDLHFDSSRQCASIPGSSRFRCEAGEGRITSYNVCYTKLLRFRALSTRSPTSTLRSD